MRQRRPWRAVAVATSVAAAISVLRLDGAQAAASLAAAGGYNVEWLEPTKEPGTNAAGNATYAGGMPLGNGDLVALAWPNVTAGGVAFYISKSDAMSSATELF